MQQNPGGFGRPKRDKHPYNFQHFTLGLKTAAYLKVMSLRVADKESWADKHPSQSESCNCQHHVRRDQDSLKQ
jgi:hypothetical protein